MDMRGEHQRRIIGGDCLCRRRQKRIKPRALDCQEQAGIRAKLPHTQCYRLHVGAGQGFALFSQGTGQHKNGVCAAHFGIHRNWLRAGVGGIEQGFATPKRSRKTNRFDSRMLHQRHTDSITPALHQPKNTSG